ncbi:hypothetical protein VTJ04DRAFT_5955 [Mycothermus thermophilus]|uniref:uncharacterized protein n=1 Tax=Humicola insolens TaxID=85995 RepID=UPI0037445D4A
MNTPRPTQSFQPPNLPSFVNHQAALDDPRLLATLGFLLLRARSPLGSIRRHPTSPLSQVQKEGKEEIQKNVRDARQVVSPLAIASSRKVFSSQNPGHPKPETPPVCEPPCFAPLPALSSYTNPPDLAAKTLTPEPEKIPRSPNPAPESRTRKKQATEAKRQLQRAKDIRAEIRKNRIQRRGTTGDGDQIGVATSGSCGTPSMSRCRSVSCRCLCRTERRSTESRQENKGDQRRGGRSGKQKKENVEKNGRETIARVLLGASPQKVSVVYPSAVFKIRVIHALLGNRVMGQRS